MDNTEANLHFLTESEKLYFQHTIEQLKSRISELCVKHDLPGNWMVSEDFRFLVRIGE